MAATQRYPAYVALARSGQLNERATAAKRYLRHCTLCPRQCGADREEGDVGVCGVGGWAQVASHFAHMGEEDCLRGWAGSGTVFFSGCNLGCVFCQNWDISHGCFGQAITPQELSEMMLHLQEEGCHNINWVTPSHVVPQALEALALAAEEGLRIPIVYNSSGYDTMEALALLDGVVDIYMPDFKFWDPEVARRMTGAADYPEVARKAIREMHRQVGDLVLDSSGLAQRGLLVRHLVLPNNLAGTAEISAWLASEVSPATFMNLMSQYQPLGALERGSRKAEFKEIDRPVRLDEVERAVAGAFGSGLRRFERRLQKPMSVD